MKIAFVGCGAAGRPLGLAWRRAGHRIGAVHCRRSARAAVEVLGEGVAGGDLRDADVVVFATPDDALAEAAVAHPLGREQVALHLSGTHPSTILAPTGARTAGLHPLCAFTDLETSLQKLPQTFCFVEGDEVALRLARDLSDHVSSIATEHKLLYHAAAVIAANYTVTLLATALDLFVQAGVGPEQATAALVQLARGSVENVGRHGLPDALTGPAARGDVELIRRHAGALGGETHDLYLRLLKATLPVARAKGGLTAEAEAALRSLVE